MIIEEKVKLITRQELCKLRRRSCGNVTQKEFAKLFNVSVSVIRRLESNKPYHPHSIRKYPKILGMSWSTIMEHVHWE